jgi:hypothetical protein
VSSEIDPALIDIGGAEKGLVNAIDERTPQGGSSGSLPVRVGPGLQRQAMGGHAVDRAGH